MEDYFRDILKLSVLEEKKMIFIFLNRNSNDVGHATALLINKKENKENLIQCIYDVFYIDSGISINLPFLSIPFSEVRTATENLLKKFISHNNKFNFYAPTRKQQYDNYNCAVFSIKNIELIERYIDRGQINMYIENELNQYSPSERELWHIKKEWAKKIYNSGYYLDNTPNHFDHLPPLCSKLMGNTHTPIYEAAKNEDKNVIKLLIEQGYDFDISNIDGKTPLLLASEAGKVDNVKILLEKGARTTVRDSDGSNALHLALKNEHLKVALELLKYSTTNIINAKDKDGNTPLNLLTHLPNIDKSEQKDITLALIKSGAQANIKNNQEIAPIDLIVNKEYNLVYYTLNNNLNYLLNHIDIYYIIQTFYSSTYQKDTNINRLVRIDSINSFLDYIVEYTGKNKNDFEKREIITSIITDKHLYLTVVLDYKEDGFTLYCVQPSYPDHEINFMNDFRDELKEKEIHFKGTHFKEIKNNEINPHDYGIYAVKYAEVINKALVEDRAGDSVLNVVEHYKIIFPNIIRKDWSFQLIYNENSYKDIPLNGIEIPILPSLLIPSLGQNQPSKRPHSDEESIDNNRPPKSVCHDSGSRKKRSIAWCRIKGEDIEVNKEKLIEHIADIVPKGHNPNELIAELKTNNSIKNIIGGFNSIKELIYFIRINFRLIANIDSDNDKNTKRLWNRYTTETSTILKENYHYIIQRAFKKIVQKF